MAATIDPGALARYVGAPGTEVTDAAYLTGCADQAAELLRTYIGTAVVPDTVRERALLETAAEFYHRRAARAGIVELGTDGITADVVRVSADPLYSAKRILSPYLGPAIA